MSGRVTDQSGSAVAAAKVEAISVTTNAVYPTESNEEGLYNIPALSPGAYRISVTKEGFQQIIQAGIELHVADSVAVNFAMALGSVTQSVTVVGDIPLVNTTTSSLGGLVNEEKVSDLPLNGRNFVDLSLLQPGVSRAITISNIGGDFIGTSYSSNGAPIRSNLFLLDGAPMQNFYGFSAASAASTELGVDGIREYKVITSNFGAEYGLAMGSQVIISSKGGSNRFSGDVFEYLRNAAMDARNYFDLSYLTTGRRIPQYQRNNYGGSVGGPIKKDKTFFYLVYEGLDENKAIPQPFLNVPGAGCHGPAGATITNIACPQLGTTNSVVVASATAPTLAMYPLPNVPGKNQFFYNFLQPSRVNYGQARVDQVLSQSDSFFGRYTTEYATQIQSEGTYFPQFTDHATSWDQFLTLSENHVFSTTLLNSARLSFSRTKTVDTSASTVNNPSLDLVPGQLPGITTIQSGASQMGSSNVTPITPVQNILSFGDDLFYTRGKHSLKLGVLINRIQAGITSGHFNQGNAVFSNIANFLIGNLAQYKALTPASNLNRDFRWWTEGFYVNDDWRASNRLTFNLGLRYEFNTTITETTGRLYSLRNPLTDTATTKGSALFRNPSLKDFSPRLGFAWDVNGDGKTSVRGGFGIYFDTPIVGTLLFEDLVVPPASSVTLVSPTAGGILPVSYPFLLPSGVAPQNTFQVVDYFSKQPYLMQWNLTLERQLPAQTNLSVSYVGTRGIHLWDAQEGNPCIPTSYTPQVLSTGPVAQGPVWATPCGLGRANSAFSTLTLFTTGAESWYNGLQVGVTKRLAHGLEFQSSYTYSKALDNGETQLLSQENGRARMYNPIPNLDKGPSIFDLTHNWRFNTLYHFPSMNSDGVLAKVANGWWTANIFAFQTGYPFNPMDTNSRSNSDVYPGTAPDRPNYGPTYNPSTVITGTVTQWYNPNMFVLEPAGQLGNVGRDILRGPHLFNWDMALNKDTKLNFLGEGGMLQFRAELFNILNRPNFGLPNVIGGESTDASANAAGAIVNTASGTNSREIQLALKVVF